MNISDNVNIFQFANKFNIDISNYEKAIAFFFNRNVLKCNKFIFNGKFITQVNNRQFQLVLERESVRFVLTLELSMSRTSRC